MKSWRREPAPFSHAGPEACRTDAEEDDERGDVRSRMAQGSLCRICRDERSVFLSLQGEGRKGGRRGEESLYVSRTLLY